MPERNFDVIYLISPVVNAIQQLNYFTRVEYVWQYLYYIIVHHIMGFQGKYLTNIAILTIVGNENT